MARHRHRPVDGRARHEAGPLGRRQHPRRRADGHRRRAAACSTTWSTATPPATTRSSPGPCAPARSTSCRGSTPTAPSGRWPTGPRFRRSSIRPWPWADAHRWPGLHVGDVDGDGRILRCAIPDPDGAWIAAPRRRPPARARPARPEPGTTSPATGCSTRAPSSTTTASHPVHAPPARGARPQPQLPGRLGHRASRDRATTRCRSRRSTRSSGPSSPGPTSAGTTRSTPAAACCCARRRRSADSELPPVDVWTWKQLGELGTAVTGYPVALGVRGLHLGPVRHDERRRRRLGLRAPRRLRLDHRVLGRRPRRHRREAVDALLVHSARPTPSASPCCAGSTSIRPTPTRGFVDWYPFDHPQLGPVELGGWNGLDSWTNPPPSPARRGRRPRRLRRRPGARRSLRRDPPRSAPSPVSAPTPGGSASASPTRGWLPTTVSSKARQDNLVRPVIADVEIDGDGVVEVLDGAVRRTLGQLAGSSSARFTNGAESTPDRASCSWLVRAAPGTTVSVTVQHQRAGSDSVELVLEPG